MEVIENIRLTTCAIVLLNIILVTGVDAIPHGRSRRGRTSVNGRNSCNSVNQYACVTEPYGKKKARCIPMAMFCNGPCDCPLGDDERLCHLLNPTVSTTKTETTTMTSTKTETTTLNPVVILDSTASMVTSVLCSVPALRSSLLATNVAYGVGATVCTALIAAANVTSAFNYIAATPTSISTVVKTLTCGSTKIFP